MDLGYFQRVNNIYESSSRQESDLYLLNKHTNDHFRDTIDYHVVTRTYYNDENYKEIDEEYELLIARDADANTMQKKIKARPGQCVNLGDYIQWGNQTWIVTLVDPDNKSYCSGQMKLCQAVLHWKKTDGTIVNRPAYVEDFTKYSGGETSNGVITVGDNQYGCIVPLDNECLHLKREMRFVLDELLECPDVYRITNRKLALNNYNIFGRGGTITLTMTIDGFNADEDRYVIVDTDTGTKGWICNYGELEQPGVKPEETIRYDIYGLDSLAIGAKKKFMATFENEKGEDISDSIKNYRMEIRSSATIEIYDGIDEFSKYIRPTNDKRNVGKTIYINVLIDNNIVAQKEVAITES